MRLLRCRAPKDRRHAPCLPPVHTHSSLVSTPPSPGSRATASASQGAHAHAAFLLPRGRRAHGAVQRASVACLAAVQSRRGDLRAQPRERGSTERLAAKIGWHDGPRPRSGQQQAWINQRCGPAAGAASSRIRSGRWRRSRANPRSSRREQGIEPCPTWPRQRWLDCGLRGGRRPCRLSWLSATPVFPFEGALAACAFVRLSSDKANTNTAFFNAKHTKRHTLLPGWSHGALASTAPASTSLTIFSRPKAAGLQRTSGGRGE